MSAVVYDWMYRIWAPWDAVGVRADLIGLLGCGEVSPDQYPRAMDLGCGTGANVVHLAGGGFDAWGVDFSEIAIRKARDRAARAGVDAHFVVADLTSDSIPGVDGPFDLLIDFGTLDDLRGPNRRAMAETITRMSRPGSKLLEFCFYGATDELPLFSFKGTSRMSHIAPGEMEELFGADWTVEIFADHEAYKARTFLLTRRAQKG